MKEQGLLVTKINRYQTKRKISRPKPKASYPNHIWGTNMTKIKIGSWGWYYLVSDNGCQPTSLSYMQACSTLGIKQIFTSWSNPKGNADTERVTRTLKEDLVWLYDWDNPFNFQRALGKWVDNYNQDYPHQSLGYHTPCEYYQNMVKIKS